MSNNGVMAWVIPAHAAVATVSLLLGAYNLLRPRKGDRQHRLIGRVWVVAMYVTILSSFAIRELRPGQFSWIHGLSVFTFVTLTIGLWAALTHRVRTHRQFMTGSYFGLVGAFVGAVAVPVRYIPHTATERPVEFGLAVLGCAVAAFAVVQLSRQSQTSADRTQAR